MTLILKVSVVINNDYTVDLYEYWLLGMNGFEKNDL